MNYINSIELYNIKKTYSGKIPALEIKKLIIPFGSVVVVMGYSGSGKSTLINIMGLTDVPDMEFSNNGKSEKPKMVFNINENEIYTITYENNKIIATDNHNIPIKEVDIRSKIFSYIFQKDYLHNNFTVKQNIQIPLIMENVQCDIKNIEDSLEFLNLDKNHTNDYPNSLSGGQAQRVAILRGVIKDNNILLADEPTSSLDAENSKYVLQLLKNKVKTKDNNKLFIWVSHDIHLIAKYSDNIVVLSDGKLVHENIVKNPGESKENEISSFLSTKDPLVGHNNTFNFKKLKLNVLDKSRYIFDYAYKGLFKSPLNPTFDFKIGTMSIIMTLLFLLFITKISYSMNGLLIFKLNNPAINNFSVIAKGGSGELNKDDVLFIKNKFKNDIKSASAVYLAPLDIKDNKNDDDLDDITDSDYVAGFRFVTFEKNDPVVESIIQKDKLLHYKKNALDMVNKNNIDALIVRNHVLEELGYKANAKNLSIRLDNFIEDIQINTISSILPNNVDGIIRSELYFKAYFGETVTLKPSMSHIVVYPKDIKDSIRLSNEITKSGKYSISNFYELKTKIETILDITRIVDIFAAILSIALVTLSVSFVYLTLYRSIERKRREIGVFLTNGISRLYFSLFYDTQAFIYFCVTTVISLAIYYSLIEYAINDFLVNSNYIKENYGDLTEIIHHLILPFDFIAYIYGVYFIFIHSLFLFMINKFISQKPVDLMRD